MTLLRTYTLAMIGAAAALAAGIGAGAIAAPQAPVAPQRFAQAGGDAPAHPPANTDTGQTRNAARSRMRECGHQWSNMKKSGAAAGMTWKDFSQGCLAKQ